MKKFLFLSAIAALLLGATACNDGFDEIVGDGEVPVQFTVNLEDGVDSRAFSDGSKADVLKVAFYTEDGEHLPGLDQEVAVTNLQATVNAKLARYHTYQVVFWAQSSNCTAYDTSDMSAIKIDYDNVNCNDESRDAFFTFDTTKVETNALSKDITLRRPFAQLNFLASDAAGVANIDDYKSKVVVTDVPTTLNGLSGEVSDTKTVTFDVATIPNETLPGFTQYKYVAMNYILASPEKELKNATLTVYDNNSLQVNQMEVANVPLVRNYRTNIVGQLLTINGVFNITVDPIYGGDTQTAADVIAAVQTPGATVFVSPTLTVDLDLSTIAEGVKIIGVGEGPKINITNNNTLSANNVTIEGVELINESNSNNKFLNVTASNVTLKNVTFNGNGLSYASGPDYGMWLNGNDANGNVVIENCDFTDQSIFRYVMLNCKGTVTIKNSKIGSDVHGCYALNTSTTSAKLVVENTELIGWTSYSGLQAPVKFNGCTFKIGAAGYGYLCPYVDTQANNCVFEWNGASEDPQEHFLYGPRNACTITFRGCTWSNGNALDSNVLATDNDSQYKDCVAIIGGATWKNLTGGNSWTLQ